MKSNSKRRVSRRLGSRQEKSQTSRSLIERLDRREYMCTYHVGDDAVSDLPWLASAVTYAEQTDTTNPLPRAAATPAPIRINAGGANYTDPSGTVWTGDKFFSGGTGDNTWVYPVANTTSDPLYYARRWGAFSYNIPVQSAGTYSVKLHFSDPKYTTGGYRKFDVKAEGATMLNDFDVAGSGGGQTAVVRTFNVAVNDGTLNLNFVKQLENPIVSAIEVIATSGTTSPPPTSSGPIAGLTLINAASNTAIGAFTNGMTLDLSGGKTYSVRADVSGTVGSVQFRVDGAVVATETSKPYTIAGDSNGGADYLPWNVPTGSHTLTVVPYSGAYGGGTAGTAYSINFSASYGTTSPPPTSPPAGTIDTFTQINYVNKAPSPIARAEALTATWNNRLYVFGGFSLAEGPVLRSDYYNPATNSWTKIADLPQRLTHVGTAHDADNAYFVGGYVGTGKGYNQIFGSNKVWKYNFASNSYSALPNLPQALSAGEAAIVGRNLHYFSGQNASRADTNIHLVLNLDNPGAGWKSAAPIPHARSHLGAVVLGGKIYTVGGQIGNDGGLTTQKWVDVYDPATNTWSTKAPMPKAVSHISSATFVMGGRIIVMGGESAHNAQLRDVFAYNPATNVWKALSPLPAAKFSGVADDINGKIVFTTGGSGTTTWMGTPG